MYLDLTPKTFFVYTNKFTMYYIHIFYSPVTPVTQYPEVCCMCSVLL